MKKRTRHFLALACLMATSLPHFLGCARRPSEPKTQEPPTKVTASPVSPFPPVLGNDWGTTHVPKEKIDLITAKQAGLDTVLLGMNVGWHGNMRRLLGRATPEKPIGIKTFWNGKGSYDPESVREILNYASQQHPLAKLVLWLQIDTYPDWIRENPGEAVRNDQGEGFVVGWHFLRTGNNPDPSKGESLAWSFYSKKLREDLRPMIREFIKTVESSKGGDQVVGYLIGGAQDAQFYLWEAGNSVKATDPKAWSDYSEPAIQAWQDWLQKKYGSPAALSDAWKQSLDSFAAARPPSAASLIGKERFHDPETEVPQRDWKRFIADGRVDLAEDIARMIRESASRPVLVGVSASENGARANMSANMRLLESGQIDFVNGPLRYDQRLAPCSPGGALLAMDSYRLHHKPIIFDTDYRTWKNKISGPQSLGPGYTITTRMGGHTSTPSELRNAWGREVGRIAIAGHSAFLDPLEGAHTFQDPLAQHEMSQLKGGMMEVAAAKSKPAAEVAVIYDERAVDALKGGLGELHMVWASAQRSELDLSGVPYSMYLLEDFKAGKVPPAKLYIFPNLLHIDEATELAIEKLKSNGTTLCFLQGTGYNLQKNDPARLSRIIGMEVAPASAAKDAKSPPASTAPLLEKPTAPAFVLPNEWVAFGPFPDSTPANGVELSLKIPEAMELAGVSKNAMAVTRSGGKLDFTPLGPVADPQRVVFAVTAIESAEEREVLIGAGADWWMTWSLNGQTVFDSSLFGNEFPQISSDNFFFPIQLKKGRNLLAVRVKGGRRGLQLAVESQDEIAQSNLHAAIEGLKWDPQLGLVVSDPEARRLANYPQSSLCGFAMRQHGGWSTIFAGTHMLRRSTIAALAERAGAWRLTPIQYAVAANENHLMIHPQLSGPVLISLKSPAALIEVNGALASQAPAREHLLDLNAFQTYLFRLGDEQTLPGSTPGGMPPVKENALVQFDFTADPALKPNPKDLRPVVRLPAGQACALLSGPGILDAHLGISGNGTPPQSLFLSADGLGAATEAEAVQKGGWFGFRTSPQRGKSLSPSELSFHAQRASENSPTHFAVYAETGGSSVRIGGGELKKRIGNTNEDFDSYIVDISKTAAVQNVTGPATFQIYLFGALPDAQAPGNVRIDSITLRGNTLRE